MVLEAGSLEAGWESIVSWQRSSGFWITAFSLCRKRVWQYRLPFTRASHNVTATLLRSPWRPIREIYLSCLGWGLALRSSIPIHKRVNQIDEGATSEKGPCLGRQIHLEPCKRDRRNNYHFHEIMYFFFPKFLLPVGYNSVESPAFLGPGLEEVTFLSLFSAASP